MFVVLKVIYTVYAMSTTKKELAVYRLLIGRPV